MHFYIWVELIPTKLHPRPTLPEMKKKNALCIIIRGIIHLPTRFESRIEWLCFVMKS